VNFNDEQVKEMVDMARQQALSDAFLAVGRVHTKHLQSHDYPRSNGAADGMHEIMKLIDRKSKTQLLYDLQPTEMEN
jgi:hypothetical protein